MGTLSARSLTQALSQARNVGLVEEPFVIDGVSVTVRNLRPEHFDSIFKDCQGLTDVEYLNAWQMAHVSRSICEMNGVDLREVTTVEIEEADPKKPGQMKAVKVELHSWLAKYVLSGWTREAIYICYRKVSDVIEAGEKKAQEGVTFRTVDETAEDKYRRLLGELTEAEADMPEPMVANILKENGLMKRSSMEEIEAAQNKLSQFSTNNQTQVVEEEPAPQPPPVVEEPPPEPPSADRLMELLRNRTPLNQTPNPILQAEIQPVQTQAPVVVPPSNRTAELAALEGMTGEVGLNPQTAYNLQPQAQIPEVRLGAPRLDPKAAQTIIDPAPSGGINPRFRPPST